ncbi:MAG TPA: hypothetical protein VMV49_13045 [Candidatus Deferrimicrobium sp.]|nr:hypothetical protein [Candidatus Deferrimicrobium sp.]
MCAKRKKKRIKKRRHSGNLWNHNKVRSVKRQKKTLIQTEKFDDAMFLLPDTDFSRNRNRADAKSNTHHHSTYRRFAYRLWAAWKRASTAITF